MERKEHGISEMLENSESQLTKNIIDAFTHSGIRYLKGEATSQAQRTVILYEELVKRGVDRMWLHCSPVLKRRILEEVSAAKNETYQHAESTSAVYLEGVISVALSSKGSVAYLERLIQEEKNRPRGF